MAPRANWKGYLKLSLVSCPVNLYPATSTSSRVSFNTINRKTGNRLKQQMIDSATGDVVEKDDQAKGYPVAKDHYILVSDDELDTIQIESTHTIEIEKFVPRSEIDPRYLDAPYYLAPNERVGEESFAVIREAMRDDKVVGLGRVVISRRERIVMLEPLGKGLLATILRYRDEVRSEDAYFEEIPNIVLPQEPKDLAHVIIERKMGHFQPELFNDRYEEAVVDLLRSKEAGMPAKAPDELPRPANVINIMDALRQSIAAEGGAVPGPAPGRVVAEAPGKTTAKPSSGTEASGPTRPKAPSRMKGKDGAAEPASAAKGGKAKT
jgi:DNA end-binding protein Ku